jgi:hypothetical protein
VHDVGISNRTRCARSQESRNGLRLTRSRSHHHREQAFILEDHHYQIKDRVAEQDMLTSFSKVQLKRKNTARHRIYYQVDQSGSWRSTASQMESPVVSLTLCTLIRRVRRQAQTPKRAGLTIQGSLVK